MAICSFISPFVLCFPCFFLFVISTSRHNITNFLSLTQQQQQQHFPLIHSAAVAAAAAAAVEIPPKARYKQKQNETHYENTTH
jgi:hypothetical protein